MAAVLDRSGRVIDANERWLRNAQDKLTLFANAELGGQYLDILSRAGSTGDVGARMLAGGISSVLQGERESVGVRYFPTTPGTGASLVVRIEGLSDPQGGAVVVVTDATRQYQAEEDARRLRGELAHMQRVATVGELAGAFVHELKQPLTAILSNAQAGQRLLRHQPPDLDELSAVLGDISTSDRRARDLLQGLHSFLRPGEMAMETVNLNALIREVVSLCESDVRLRQVEANVTLAPRLPLVLGDKIQLQQVVLNLLLNSLDALAQWHGARRLHLRTSRKTDQLVKVMISDSGPGIPKNRLDRVFESFFTTKPQGLGMGLAIARTIVRAHGGDIRAANNRRGGASVTLTLPSVARNAI
jgi:C4-dicarboxylate-specific signal transduction histidine kinase